MVPERIADIELATKKDFKTRLIRGVGYYIKIDRYLSKPSGSYGARHQLGASSRNCPSPEELNVHAYNKIIRKIISTIAG